MNKMWFIGEFEWVVLQIDAKPIAFLFDTIFQT